LEEGIAVAAAKAFVILDGTLLLLTDLLTALTNPSRASAGVPCFAGG
jgi:hypothetical protein